MIAHLLCVILMEVSLVSAAPEENLYPFYGKGRCEADVLPISEASIPAGAKMDGVKSPSGNIVFKRRKTLAKCAQLCEESDWCSFYSWKTENQNLQGKAWCYISKHCNLVSTRDNGFDNASDTYSTYFKFRASNPITGYDYVGEGTCVDSDGKPLYTYWQSGNVAMNPSKCAATCSQHDFCLGFTLKEHDPTYCSLEAFQEGKERSQNGAAGFMGRVPLNFNLNSFGTSIQQVRPNHAGPFNDLEGMSDFCYKKATACFDLVAKGKRCSTDDDVEVIDDTDANACRDLAVARGQSFFAYNIDKKRCEIVKNTFAESVSCGTGARDVKNHAWHMFKINTRCHKDVLEDCDRYSRDVEECGACFFDEQCAEGLHCFVGLGVCVKPHVNSLFYPIFEEPNGYVQILLRPGGLSQDYCPGCSGVDCHRSSFQRTAQNSVCTDCHAGQDWYPLNCDCRNPKFPFVWMQEDRCPLSYSQRRLQLKSEVSPSRLISGLE